MPENANDAFVAWIAGPKERACIDAICACSGAMIRFGNWAIQHYLEAATALRNVHTFENLEESAKDMIVKEAVGQGAPWCSARSQRARGACAVDSAVVLEHGSEKHRQMDLITGLLSSQGTSQEAGNLRSRRLPSFPPPGRSFKASAREPHRHKLRRLRSAGSLLDFNCGFGVFDITLFCLPAFFCCTRYTPAVSRLPASDD
ncbi:PUM-HD domain-containing protein [Mycena venus]|uniref:PUM-HD domain-containing protein n=1 Tax=Mycena venus TaxID=2733690 RepID=A0A8H7CG21_9AGAR|nr:PUM-HD domain-containing protein [Mycena venus]